MKITSNLFLAFQIANIGPITFGALPNRQLLLLCLRLDSYSVLLFFRSLCFNHDQSLLYRLLNVFSSFLVHYEKTFFLFNRKKAYRRSLRRNWPESIHLIKTQKLYIESRNYKFLSQFFVVLLVLFLFLNIYFHMYIRKEKSLKFRTCHIFFSYRFLISYLLLLFVC